MVRSGALCGAVEEFFRSSRGHKQQNDRNNGGLHVKHCTLEQAHNPEYFRSLVPQRFHRIQLRRAQSREDAADYSNEYQHCC